MKRLGVLVGLVTIFACNNKKTSTAEAEAENSAFDYESFSARFTAASLPYGISDTALLQHKDTAGIRNVHFLAQIPDSVKQKLVGKTGNIKLVPLAKIEQKGSESYFVLKAVGGNRQAALLTVFTKDGQYSASFPLLVPDSKKETFQHSTLDKALSISRIVSHKTEDEVFVEGKDVYVYNAEAKDFTLIMTDLLDDSQLELINPIDTFARSHRFAGDYANGKRNIVSIRDGRTNNELAVFIHFEKDDGECTGEIKGTALMTSTTTAAYREGGNPCVIELKFTGNKVTLTEAGGCGTYRGLKCTFDGTYTRKKAPDEVKQAK